MLGFDFAPSSAPAILRRRGPTVPPPGLPVGDLFKPVLYTGTGADQPIATGIDLVGPGADPLGQGGLVWIKRREGGAGNHMLFDTLRGAGSYLVVNNTGGATASATGFAFGAAGFSAGGASVDQNAAGTSYAAYTFRRAARFMDVVAYTGDGTTGRMVPHALGVKPGMFVLKRLDALQSWIVYHASIGATHYTTLNGPQAATALATIFDNTEPTAAAFCPGSSTAGNAAGGSYMAYLFASEPVAGCTACGSYVANGSEAGPTVDLGWQPQFLMIKNATTTNWQWTMLDAARGLSSAGNDPWFFISNGNEQNTDVLTVSPTGFQLVTTGGYFNRAGDTYLYYAVRAP